MSTTSPRGMAADRFDVRSPDGPAIAVWVDGDGSALVLVHGSLQEISHLLLYEPSLGLAYPPGAIEAVERTVAEGDDDAAITTVLRDVLEATDAQIDAMRAGTEWAGRVATARTVAHLEGHAHIAHRTDPAMVAAIVREFVAS